MQKRPACVSFILLFSMLLSVQTNADEVETEYYYLILFKDKKLNYRYHEDASVFLSPKALERRKRMGIAIDSFDLPVSPVYLDNLDSEKVTIRYLTRWLNGAVIMVREPEDANILKLKFFVEKVVYLGKAEISSIKGKSLNDEIPPLSFEEKQAVMVNDESQIKFDNEVNKGYGEAYNQMAQLNGDKLHELGLTAKGVSIAVFDAGFFKADRLSTFHKLFDENRVKFTWDLVDMEKNVYDDDDHGLHVLSCLAAYTPNRMIGTAPDADYYLFRTEIGVSEYLIEELNWVRAAEMADSLGVDIINSSLGYSTFDDKRMNHTKEEMDGKSSYVSKAAAIAVSRGIFVGNSAGNDGDELWKIIGAPADVENVLCVGSVDIKGNLSSFSSVGPTADHRLKPDVCAMGGFTTIASTFGTFYQGNGTSYAAPVLCGVVACLIQTNRNIRPEKFLAYIRNSGDRVNKPDSNYGYGIPDMFLAYTISGGNGKFDYTHPAMVYAINDTIDANLVIDLYGAGFQKAEMNIYRIKNFLFFKWSKSVAKETHDFRNDKFLKAICHLNKPSQKGVLYIKIKATNPIAGKGGYEVVNKKFYNKPAQ
jgi:hypothetical protein